MPLVIRWGSVWGHIPKAIYPLNQKVREFVSQK